MERIEIELKNEKTGTYTIISWLISIMNLLGFAFFSYVYGGNSRIYAIGAAALLLIILTIRWLGKMNGKRFDHFAVAFTIIITGWIFVGAFFTAAINFVLYLFQDVARRKLIVLVFEDRIIYPSFPRRTLLWSDLNNVVLRDDILTIDQKDNRVYQNEIISEINESQFNEFCRQQLKEVHK